MKIFNMKDIVVVPNPLLKEKSMNVEVPLLNEDFETLQGMAAFVLESQAKETDANNDKYTSAIGMAAPQFGINKNMFVIALADDDGDLFVYAIVNPVIEKTSKKLISLIDGEKCLSIPDGENEKVLRAESIRWSGYLVDLKTGEYEYKKMTKMQGYLGLVFQHEYDHLNGVLYTDISETPKFSTDRNFK